MGKMKYVYMLMQQNRIQELEQNYKQALDAQEEHFIFDNDLMHTAKAKAIIDYAKVYIDDSINSPDV